MVAEVGVGPELEIEKGEMDTTGCISLKWDWFKFLTPKY